MKIKQISLFIENRIGHVRHPLDVLAKADINILTLSLADTQQFGILRLIVDEWEKAKEALEAAGHVVSITDVLAIEVEDRPGGLAKILGVLEKAEINIEYMYAFTFGRGSTAVLIFRFENSDAAIQVLQAAGINVVAKVDLLGGSPRS